MKLTADHLRAIEEIDMPADKKKFAIEFFALGFKLGADHAINLMKLAIQTAEQAR